MHSLLDILSPLLIDPLFLTGELLRKLFTGGRHRIRWWDHDDTNTALGSWCLGVLFWAPVALLLAWWLNWI